MVRGRCPLPSLHELKHRDVDVTGNLILAGLKEKFDSVSHVSMLH